MSPDAIAALRERQDQLFKEGHFERAANVLFDRKRIGDHNEIWETECQKPAAAK